MRNPLPKSEMDALASALTGVKQMYQVQQFAAGKWYPVKSYDLEVDALEHAAKLPNSRVRKV